MKSKSSKKNIEKKKVILIGYKIYVAVVQLEERFPAKEEVIGSNPIGYTIVDNSELQFAIFGLLELFLGSTFISSSALFLRSNRSTI